MPAREDGEAEEQARVYDGKGGDERARVFRRSTAAPVDQTGRDLPSLFLVRVNARKKVTGGGVGRENQGRRV